METKITRKRKILSNHRLAASTVQTATLLIIGILVGSGIFYAVTVSTGQALPVKTVTVPPEVVTLTQTSTQTSTQVSTVTGTSVVTQTTLPSSTGALPSQVVQPMAPPAGWQTSTAKALGVTLVAEYNSSSGPAAWNATAHPVVYVTSNGLGYAGAAPGTPTSVGIALIDANTYQVLLTKQFFIGNQTVYNESHGTGVSMDGNYIYLPTGNPSAPTSAQRGEIIVIDARTLMIHQIIEAPASSGFHHFRAFRLYNGTDVELAEPFQTQAISALGGTPGTGGTASGGAIFLMDPAKDNQIIGGFPMSSLPILAMYAFAHPDGEHLFVSACAPTVTSPSSLGSQPGAVYVVDMKTWTLVQTYPAAAPGSCPRMFAFTDDGKYTYYDDSAYDLVTKVDNVALQQVVTVGSPTVGPYGLTLNYNQTDLYVVGKGPGHGNFGKTVGEMSATTLADINDYVTGTIEADHAINNPVHINEIWLSANVNDRDVAFNTATNTVVATMYHSGSSHNGAFVGYTVLPNGQWKGQLLADQEGYHCSALVAQEKALGVTQVYYGNQNYKTEDQRALSGECV